MSEQPYPRPCGLCPGQIESKEDLEWHGLGNCVPICDICAGSGIENKAALDAYVQEKVDQHAPMIAIDGPHVWIYCSCGFNRKPDSHTEDPKDWSAHIIAANRRAAQHPSGEAK